MNLIQNKKIWIIGASTGIGAELTYLLAKNNSIALSARNEEKLNLIKEKLPFNNHLAFKLDVTCDQSFANAAKIIEKEWNEIDIVIYNAGTYSPSNIKEYNLKESQEILNTNLQGAFRMLDVILPKMLKNKTGHIVLVGSVAGYRGLPNSLAYGSSKAGLIHLAESLKIDLKPFNIKVQLVSPGFVETRLTAKNKFKMPMIISAKKAAEYITKGLTSDKFEIHFPKKFTLILKLLKLLPNFIYFKIINSA